MLDSANAAISFTQGRLRKDLDTDRQLLSALTRELEILGEAANYISQSTQSNIPEIPWKQIISMRNRLIHAYFDVSEYCLEYCAKHPSTFLPNLRKNHSRFRRSLLIINNKNRFF